MKHGLIHLDLNEIQFSLSFMNICAELLDPAGLFCCFKHLPSAIQQSKEFLLQNSQMIYFGFGRLHYFTLHTDTKL